MVAALLPMTLKIFNWLTELVSRCKSLSQQGRGLKLDTAILTTVAGPLRMLSFYRF